MGVERHAYGAVLCGLVCRRNFVLCVCGICLAISLLQCSSWLMEIFLGTSDTAAKSCIGYACYEVWTCMGMSGTTQSIREPLLQLAGVVVFAIGLSGCKYGDRHQLLAASKGIMVLAIVYLGSAIYDLVYEKVCGAYTPNVILGFIASYSRLPPAPLSGGLQTTLRHMTAFPVEKVDELTGGFNVLGWYLAMVVPFITILFYTAVEAEFLGELVERGPLGLGVNYGLGQWDEVLNHEAILVQKEKLRRSKFIDDAVLPLPFHVNDDTPHGFSMGTGYGAAGKEP